MNRWKWKKGNERNVLPFLFLSFLSWSHIVSFIFPVWHGTHNFLQKKLIIENTTGVLLGLSWLPFGERKKFCTAWSVKFCSCVVLTNFQHTKQINILFQIWNFANFSLDVLIKYILIRKLKNIYIKVIWAFMRTFKKSGYQREMTRK